MRISNAILLFLASLAMMIALMAQNVTVASGRYWGVFSVSMVALLVAGGCGGVVIRRGGWMRWGALVVALPSAIVVLDWLRRLPYMLRSG